MAKKIHAYSFKGAYDHKNKVIGEYDKKSEVTTYYALEDILAAFDGRQVSITVKEEDEVPSVEAPLEDEEE